MNRLLPSLDLLTKDTSETSETREANPVSSERTCRIFVYGTLRHGEINDIARAATRFGRADIPAPWRIGAGYVPGTLVDFGAWPGLVPLRDASANLPAATLLDVPVGAERVVYGDVFRIDLALLPILDEIEGIRPEGREAFYRDEVDVTLTLTQAEPMQSVCRCYFYPIDAAAGTGLPDIGGGDWIAYRRARDGG